MIERIRVAEDVTPAHVDRLADALAERLVFEACKIDQYPRCGIEVAIDSAAVTVTGFIVADDQEPGSFSLDPRVMTFDDDDIAELMAEEFVAAGYRGAHELVLPVRSSLDYDRFDEDERRSRYFSDDQSIVVGFAVPDETLEYMPIETVAARNAQRALHGCALANPSELGPDGKVLVGVREGDDGSFLEFVNVSVQHSATIGYGRLHELIVPAVLAGLTAVPGLEVPNDFDPTWFVVNGRGAFVAGGARGDNGLSGKKLVADHYGPRVPIGGGALSGKDPLKADRVGALRARSLAVTLADVTGLEALVTFGWFPGAAEPRHVQAELSDGQVLDRGAIDALIGLPDLSLMGSADDLEISARDWPALMRAGYFGTGQLWDRP